MRSASAWICTSCQRAVLRHATRPSGAVRPFTTGSPLRAGQAVARKDDEQDADGPEHTNTEQGAMSKRLSDMAEESMDTGSTSDLKTMQQAGFSDELKAQLEQRIAQSTFKHENQRAFAEVNMPSAAGEGTRAHATAQPWTGTESLHDATLRLLDDGHKRIRMPARVPKIPLARPTPQARVSAADRLASAREKTSIYAISQQSDLSEKEREELRKQLKERFTPGARPMPTTLQGLTSLANERIEDAIARGQFKNIARGKGVSVERDYTANSPFLDTTEYFMNKIIQKQEIVPPWIEKQQEVVRTVATFRARLRHDWKRHAARVISSKGGSVDDQVRRARAYALAEERANPRATKVERLSEIGSDGTLSTVTVEERIAAGVATDQATPDANASSNTNTSTNTNTNTPATTITVTETPAGDEPVSQPSTWSPHQGPHQPPEPSPVLATPYPFRDPIWESTERAYHTLAIADLNSLTRSYNLMAPRIAQKPYYTLARELNRCFAEVAPQLPDFIRERAGKVDVRVRVVGGGKGRTGVLEKFAGTGHVARVRDEDLKRKGYGLAEWWRDLFSTGQEKRKGDGGQAQG